MTALIVIGIVIAALVVHFTIGNIAAGLMSSKVAELSHTLNTEYIAGTGYYEYEWRSNYDERRWLLSGWEPKGGGKNVAWKKTGRQRYAGGDEPKTVETYGFSQRKYRDRMTFIRWLWFIGVPSTMAASVDNKMIEKYDPSVAERKALQQANRIAELEKELEIESA